MKIILDCLLVLFILLVYRVLKQKEINMKNIILLPINRFGIVLQ